MDTVTIRKRKRPAGAGVWSGYLVAEDASGLWVYTPAGSSYVGHDGHRVERCEVAQDSQGHGRDSVVLLPRGRWFVAHFAYGGELLVHVDICTPPVFIDGVWSYDDLELDPYLTAEGVFGIEDEDEFLHSCREGLVRPRERDAVARAVEWIAVQIGRPDAPLIVAGQTRLSEARTLQLRPVHSSTRPFGQHDLDRAGR